MVYHIVALETRALHDLAYEVVLVGNRFDGAMTSSPVTPGMLVIVRLMELSR